ncbi:aldo/keto reductase [Chloroflexota bacterium]
MEKICLGKTGMMVSRIGFGGLPIQRNSEDESVAVVRRCMELGITFIDTANSYTTSEEHIGKAISGQREKLILATKSHAQSREEIERNLKLSLKHLGTEAIDLFQFHNVADPKSLDTILAPDGPLSVIEEAKKAGVIKHIGVTSHSLDTAKKLVESDRFETIMVPFNFITCEAADELLPLTREHGVGFIAMKPMAGGMLDNATIAIKYLLQFPDVVPIIGIQKTHEIDEIAQLLEGPWTMTEAEQLEMRRLKEELGTRFCRRCDYCQPCTEGINISGVMIIDSFVKRLPPEKVFTGKQAERVDKAANCSECGDCEERCPYHLPIREMLAEKYKWYQEQKRKYQEQLASGQ